VQVSVKPRACVLGDIDLVRPLGLAGIRCAVVAPPGDPIRYSRFTTHVLDWLDPWKDAEALVERLLEFAATQPAKPVLYYEEDRDLLLVSRHRSRLRDGFRFVVPDPELVENLVDKARFRTLAERLKLPTPPTCRVNPAGGSHVSDVDLRYPIVVKPLTRKTEAWMPIAGSNKALRVDDEDGLRSLWGRLAEAGIEVLAQELIAGPETRIESYHVFVDETGRVVGEFTGRKIRTYPAEFGYSTALTITDQRDVLELGRDLVERLGLRGVAKFDFKRAEDGTLYLLEVNPRFNLWHHLGAVAGVNLPAAVFSHLNGRPARVAPRARAGTTWCYPWYDALAARAWGVPPIRWLAWLYGCEAKSAIAIDDPMPFLRGVLWRRLARAFEGRVRRPDRSSYSIRRVA
jgi:D-aspartate ligase